MESKSILVSHFLGCSRARTRSQTPFGNALAAATPLRRFVLGTVGCALQKLALQKLAPGNGVAGTMAFPNGVWERVAKTTAMFCALILCVCLPAMAYEQDRTEIPLNESDTLIGAYRVETVAGKSSFPKINLERYTGTPSGYSCALLLRSGTAVTQLNSFTFENDPALSGAGPMFWLEDAIMVGDHLYYLFILKMELQLGVAVKNKEGIFATHYFTPFPSRYNRILNGYFFKDKQGTAIVALPIPGHGPRYQSPYYAFRIDANGMPIEVKP